MDFDSQVNFQLLDAGGRAIQGGFAWLTVHATGLGTEISKREAVDQSGRVAIQLDDRFRERLAYHSQAALWLVDTQFRISGADIPSDAFSSGAATIEVSFLATRELAAVTILNSNGLPVVHARVAADSLGFSADDAGRIVPDEVWTAASMLTDSQGKCFADLPAGQLNPYVRIEAESLGTQLLPLSVPEKDGSYVFRLGKCKRVTARLAGESPVSVRLETISRLAAGQSARKRFHLNPGAEEKGWLLSGGDLILRPQIVGESDRIAFVDQPPARLAEDSTTQLNIAVDAGIAVRGRVVKGSKNIPVAGARLMFSGSAINDTFVELMTDADGGYQLRCKPGILRTNGAVDLPRAVYVHVEVIERQIEQKLGHLTLPDIKLPDFVWVAGTLRDENGQPVPGEDISYGDDPARRLSTTTGVNGQFWLPVTEPISESSFYLVGRSPSKVVDREPLVLLKPGRQKNSTPRVRLRSK
jgi:hypothetical protein